MAARLFARARGRLRARGARPVSTLPETVSMIRDARKPRDIYLLGTAHVSKRSADEARDLIRLVQPSTVFVELCPARAAKLRAGHTEDDFMRDIRRAAQKQLAASPLAGLAAASPALTNLGGAGPLARLLGGGAGSGGSGGPGAKDPFEFLFKRLYGMFKAYGVVPGLEFKVAMEEAERIGAEVVCGDRSQTETLDRLRRAAARTDWLKALTTPMSAELEAELSGALGGASFGGGFEALFSEASLEAMKDRRRIRAMRAHFEKIAPEMMEALLHERDEIMAKRIQSCPPDGSVVAVVGMAHMDGLERRMDASTG
jgi:pheromone shutdown protein TraB